MKIHFAGVKIHFAGVQVISFLSVLVWQQRGFGWTVSALFDLVTAGGGQFSDVHSLRWGSDGQKMCMLLPQNQ